MNTSVPGTGSGKGRVVISREAAGIPHLTTE